MKQDYFCSEVKSVKLVAFSSFFGWQLLRQRLDHYSNCREESRTPKETHSESTRMSDFLINAWFYFTKLVHCLLKNAFVTYSQNLRTNTQIQNWKITQACRFWLHFWCSRLYPTAAMPFSYVYECVPDPVWRIAVQDDFSITSRSLFDVCPSLHTGMDVCFIKSKSWKEPTDIWIKFAKNVFDDYWTFP